MEDIMYWLWLSSINDVGPVRAKSLLEKYKTPYNIWCATEKQLLLVDGITENIAKSIISSKNNYDFEKEMNKIKKHNIEAIIIKDNDYPEQLKNIYDNPIIFYSAGKIEPQDNLSVAIVGSRNATSYGMKVAYELAKQLALEGITVVSGMARGIDTAAHKGALDGGGRTIAVLGCGLDFIYPPENKDLMNKIIKNGAVISEYRIGTPPDAKNFPSRNRIISGMTLGTVIVEANKNSGSLITADFALEQNREVFAVPGPINIKFSEGTNNLIKQGAKLVTDVQDILEELNLNTNINKKIEVLKEVDYNSLGLNIDEIKIYSNISSIPIHLENIMKLSGFTIDKLNMLVTMLELKGLIKQLPGKQFVKS